jgi:hypothetical protein
MEHINTTPQILIGKHIEIMDVTSKAVKKRPVIYDDEIGLWEELETRDRQKVIGQARVNLDDLCDLLFEN